MRPISQSVPERPRQPRPPKFEAWGLGPKPTTRSRLQPKVQFHHKMTADPSRMHALASEMVALAPDVIVVHTNVFLAALRQVNRDIPTVFAQVGDPVGNGFVDNLALP